MTDALQIATPEAEFIRMDEFREAYARHLKALSAKPILERLCGALDPRSTAEKRDEADGLLTQLEAVLAGLRRLPPEPEIRAAEARLFSKAPVRCDDELLSMAFEDDGL